MKRVIDLTLRVADGTATDAECRELERLTESDRRQLADTGEPSRLVEAMSAAGILAPATMLGVLPWKQGEAEQICPGEGVQQLDVFWLVQAEEKNAQRAQNDAREQQQVIHGLIANCLHLASHKNPAARAAG